MKLFILLFIFSVLVLIISIILLVIGQDIAGYILLSLFVLLLIMAIMTKGKKGKSYDFKLSEYILPNKIVLLDPLDAMKML